MKMIPSYAGNALFFIALSLLVPAQAATPAENTATGSSAEWLDQDKFGM